MEFRNESHGIVRGDYPDTPCHHVRPACTVQSEHADDLRDIVFDIVQTSIRFDGLFVFGPGSEKLPTKPVQLDVTSFFLVASNVVTFQ